MKKRIIIGFGSLLFIFLIGSLVSVAYLTRTTQRMDRLILLHQVEILREDLIIHIQQVQSSIARNKTRSGGDIDVLVAHVQEMDKVMDSCVECHHTPELTQGLLGMRDMANDYKTAISQLVTASANPAKIALLERRAQDLGQELITMTQGMAFAANVRLQQKTQETMAMMRDVRMVLGGTLLLGFCLALLTTVILTKGLQGRLRKLLEATERISRGELQHRVDINDSPGSEFRELAEAFNVMTRNLHQSQRQLVQSAKLAAIGELATNIAYEVNNPLTGVLGYTGLLLKTDDIPANKKEQLKTIERETLRAREILKNLLDFARRKPPLMVKTEMQGLIQETLELVNGQPRRTNMRIEVECPDGLPSVSVDPEEMKRVFVNLINNANFAMSNDGTLKIRCRQGRDMAGKENVFIEFADAGVGIPESQLDKIFDPFFTTRIDGEGTGLGLSISYMIVQNHGGRIEVESKIGEGSTFRVCLPA
jgi:signal transduction histidine kinase